MKGLLCTALIAALAVSGCAAQKQTYLPDGSQGYSANCSGQMLTWGACYEAAGKTCKAAGYTIVAKEGDSAETAAATPQLFAAGTVQTRNLLYRCNR